MEREGGVAGQVLGIGREKTQRIDPLVQELRRLNYVPTKPDKTGKFGEEDRRRSPEEYKLFTKVVGERTRLALYDAIDSDEYKDPDTTDADRIEILQDAVSDVRAEAQDEEVDSSTHDATEDILYKPLREKYQSRYATEQR
jgi:hypothetical protein